MLKFVCFFAFIALVVADPPRPNPSETFFAEVGVESHDHDSHLFGEGVWGIDQPANKGVEDYRLRSGIHEVRSYTLQRFDIGEVFEIDSIDSQECRERVVNGSMPPFWEFLKYAKYIGKDIFRHAEVDLWEATFAGTALRLGVIAPEYNRPAFFERRSGSHQFVVEFHKFDNVTVDPKHFDIPSECQRSKTLKSSIQDPPRPKFSETFFAEVGVESHDHDDHFFGEGIWGIDQPANKAVEDYHLRSGLRSLRTYNLQRFDMHAVYEIDSLDPSECRMRVVNGTLPPFWGWVSQATYAGKDIFRHAEVDLWDYSLAGVYLRVGVLAPEYNRPVFFERRHAGSQFLVEFHKYDNVTVDPKHFVVPGECERAKMVEEPQVKGLSVGSPARPNITETFEAEFEIRIDHDASHSVGKGRWAQDFSAQMAGEDADIEEEHSHNHFRVFELARYDKLMFYEISSQNRSECHRRALTGRIPATWSWLSQATYDKTIVDHEGVKVDIWTYKAGGVEINIAVDSLNVNTPRFLGRKSAHRDEEYFFRLFAAQTPSPEIFTIPQECQ